jgi:superfamily I DNA/RNA helicase
MFCLDELMLNDAQRAAILAPGNVFLLACPGSGKTRTLTYKIAKELTEIQSEKQFVAAITYTHRAADEIHDRIERLGIDTSQLWIGTIHSFCLEWILRPYSIYHPKLRYGFHVIDPHDKDALIDDLCKPYRGAIRPRDCEFYFVRDRCVPTCRDPSKLEIVQSLLQEYFRTLAKKRQIDFELILFYAHQLMEREPLIGTLLSNLFVRILVDEYQDTKEIQYSIIAAILRAGGGKTGAFIVGDPNQAIFESLGGFAMTPDKFEAIAGIPLSRLPLSGNYRSSERIISYFSKYQVLPAAIEALSEGKDYPSLITYDCATTKDKIQDQIASLIEYNIRVARVPQNEICVIAPWWAQLASVTRQLAARLPEYRFDGPGMVPFARDQNNFWYKVSKIALSEPSPAMYVTRLRWAGDVLAELQHAGLDIAGLTRKALLKEFNSIRICEEDGLTFLRAFFAQVCVQLGIQFERILYLRSHYDSFFEGSQARIDRLMREENSLSITDIATFRRVFATKSGITVSTVHGIKGAEYDAVIAYALLDGMIPNFYDSNPEEAAKKMLYVISSRARKNLHLISETQRLKRNGEEYEPTPQLAECAFRYDDVPARLP